MDSDQFIEKEIKSFVATSPLNHIPIMNNPVIYNEPLVGFSDGDEPIFTEYRTIVGPIHATPREILAKVFNKSPEEVSTHVSVITWILPIRREIRESNRQETANPSRLWTSVEYYGGYIFLEAMQQHMVGLLTKMGHLAVAPGMEPYFKDTMLELQTKGEDIRRIKEELKERGISNWSEKHAAYAAGLGTFSFSGNFISERGVAITIGSVVTSLALPASERTAENPYANCLFYATGDCELCARRCPVEAITDKGHDDIKCAIHFVKLKALEEKYNIGRAGCGMCLTKVPCEFCNPTKHLKKSKLPNSRTRFL